MSFVTTRWSGRKCFLDKMTLRELVWAYATYPAIQGYALLGVVGLGLAAYWGGGALRLLAPAVATVVVYPLVWYVLHRRVLHDRLLYRFPQAAPLWKRIHFDHHQDPNDLGVLFDYGINNYFWDRLFATFYADPKGFPRNETIFNLAYTGAESGRFPWVATLSGLVPGKPVSRRGRAE